jgi:lathosterol oxidase
VISDEWADQIVRTLPLLLLPMALPTNIDLLFAQFALLFYAYGVYLHWGFESPLISAHQPIINGAYEHYFHHAFSAGASPIYTGFFFKLWDQAVGTVETGPCVCSTCETAKGKRSRKAYDKVLKPDYSVLLQPAFWLEGGGKQAGKQVD